MDIIGGARGSTIIEIKGEYEKHDEDREKRIEEFANELVSEPHSLEEVEVYIVQKYKARCVDEQEEQFQKTFKSIKATLILSYRPELIETQLPRGGVKWNVESERTQYMELLQKRNEEAIGIPNDIFPIHVKKYIIPFYKEDRKTGEIQVDMEICYGLIRISSRIQSKEKGQIEEIVKDIYTYYGVEEKNKRGRTERFMTLFTVMKEQD